MTAGRAKHREQRRTPVNAAVLGLVIERPSYGYEVWQRFEARFGGVIEVGASRIYQAFDGLLADGLIEQASGAAVGSRRQPRPCYRATDRGTRAHRAWLAEELRGDPARLELNRRLLATGADDVPTLLAVVDRYEQACLDEMAELHPDARPAVKAMRDRLLAEERRLVLEARMKWILFARRQLEAVGAPPRRQLPTESS
ncbi:MAG TPA: PadR family transcriptional regulator [Conexibacter sp.]|nr:PadR family transcriptional regulator [Conexibacter sp.]